MSQNERTGWRDQMLSERHRQWGYNLPAVDIDFLLLEFDKAKPVAIIEYKNENATIQHSYHPSYRAIIELANKADLPFFGVRYASDCSWFKVTPLNKIAKEKTDNSMNYTEEEYKSFLYQLRGRVNPSDRCNYDYSNIKF